MKIKQSDLINGLATVAIIKDAGDDPDVTHGATIFVQMRLSEQQQVIFSAAKGVGVVTRAGLSLAVGEAAINPVPRQMITEHLLALAKEHGYRGGYRVAVGVENGEQIALKTMNPRLGIVGGLSILGTTGIVRPFSCGAYIASIRQAIDVCCANGINQIAATTGNGSEQFIRSKYSLPDMAFIEMGDFVGVLLKHIKKSPIKKLTLCGGFGKISKLAAGNNDLHSRNSSIDFEQLAQHATTQGATSSLLERVRNANTSIEALTLCEAEGVYLGNSICQQALQFVRTMLPTSIELDIWAVNRSYQSVGCASNFRQGPHR